MGRLEGKVAAITGGASGIGAGTVRRFVEEGAKVLIADLDTDKGTALAAELGAATAFLRTDVSKEEDVAAMIAETTDRWGRIDVLFNNAGFGGALGPIESTSLADYDLTMDVLVKSVFLGIKHASPYLKAQGSGSIISTASVCGIMPTIGAHLYNVAKAGVIMMTKTAAVELAEHDIRVNCICPGYVATQLHVGRTLSELDDDEAAERMDRARERTHEAQPIARMGEVEDIASMALFLASDESAWVTGTAQVVDGGLILGKPWRKLPKMITDHKPMRMYVPED